MYTFSKFKMKWQKRSLAPKGPGTCKSTKKYATMMKRNEPREFLDLKSDEPYVQSGLETSTSAGVEEINSAAGWASREGS